MPVQAVKAVIGCVTKLLECDVLGPECTYEFSKLYHKRCMATKLATLNKVQH